MWAHDYPFGGDLKEMLQSLDPHQKINHFPGSGFITNKVSLAVNHFPFIPPAFVIPKDTEKFLEEVEKHPQKLWVEKSNNHRGIHIKLPKDIDLSKGSDQNFVQEYIANPFLVDERKFDIGIYTVLTSIDPLRVYVYDREVLIRFCEKDYYPFDPDDEQKYVVEDSYTQPWEVGVFTVIHLTRIFNSFFLLLPVVLVASVQIRLIVQILKMNGMLNFPKLYY